MAALQAVSDPASLDRGLAGSNQEVPISSSSAKQRHRRWCWKASLKIFLLVASPAPQLNRVQKWREAELQEVGEKVGQKAGKSLPFVCHLSSFT